VKTRALGNAVLWVLAALLAKGSPCAFAQTSGVLREVYTGIGGTAVADLTNSPAFPDQPSLVEVLLSFEAPTDVDDNYGQRLSAFLLPPASGTYVFWIASDDNSGLFLSTDETPANKRLIASVSGWTSSREWSKYPEQQSAGIALLGGKKYYVEALMKEAGGGDNLAVRWKLPNGTIEEPLPGTRLQVYGLGPPQINRQPSSVTVVEGGSATFSVELARSFGASFQWFQDGAALSGATNASCTVGPVEMSDNGARFYCWISNSQGSTNSSTATLTVLPDQTPPTISSVVNLGDNTVLTVRFSEPVEAASGGNSSNYSINNGIVIRAASFAGDSRSVVLTTSPMSPGIVYTLTVNNVRDCASTPNLIAPNTQCAFTVDFTPLDISNLAPNREAIGPSSRRTGLVMSEVMYHPTNRAGGAVLQFIELYNSQVFAEDLSGYGLSGAFSFSFPTNTLLPAGGRLVVAPVPADVQSA